MVYLERCIKETLRYLITFSNISNNKRRLNIMKKVLYCGLGESEKSEDYFYSIFVIFFSKKLTTRFTNEY